MARFRISSLSSVSGTLLLLDVGDAGTPTKANTASSM
jgi:hypothetical protein